MSLKFLAKKSWNVTNLDNVERVWIAEQAAEKEARKLKELQKQINEERQIQELRELQVKSGQAVKVVDTTLDWMYEGPAAQADQSSEEYLLGKIYKPKDTGENIVKETAKKPGSLWMNKVSSKNDMFTRLHEDPLLMMKRSEKEAHENVINNPVKMARIRQQLAQDVERKESKKRKKEEKKQEKKKLKKEEKERKSSRREPSRSRSRDKDTRDSDRDRDRGRDRSRDRVQDIGKYQDRDRGRGRDNNRNSDQDREGNANRARDTGRGQRIENSNFKATARSRSRERSRTHEEYGKDKRIKGDVRGKSHDASCNSVSGKSNDRKRRRSHSRSRSTSSQRSRSRGGGDRRRQWSQDDEFGRSRSSSGNQKSLMKSKEGEASGEKMEIEENSKSISRDSDKKYGLLKSGGSSSSSSRVQGDSSYLGPNRGLLDKKVEKEKDEANARQAAVNRARSGQNKKLTAEEKAKKLAEMEQDASTHDQMRFQRQLDKRRAGAAGDGGEQKEEGRSTASKGAFLSTMRKAVYNSSSSSQGSLGDTMSRNKHYQQKGDDLDSHGFMRR